MFPSLSASDQRIGDSLADEVNRCAGHQVLASGVLEGLAVISDPPRSLVLGPIAEHVTRLSLAEMLRGLARTASEYLTTDQFDPAYVFKIRDLYRLAQPTAVDDLRKMRQVDLRARGFESHRLHPPAAALQDVVQQLRLVNRGEVAEDGVVREPVCGHDADA
jgi:hypothetical protein